MKRIQTIGFIFTLMISFFSCEIKVDDPAGPRGTAIVPSISEPVPGIFIIGLEDSFIEFEVDIPDGAQLDKTEVVLSYGSNFERLKIADLTSFPVTVSFTLGEALDILGVPLASVEIGDIIFVEVETTSDGLTTRSNASLAIPVVCEFDHALTYGNYTAVSSDWQVNGPVTITPDPGDQYTIYVTGLATLDKLTEDKGPLVMHINPDSFKVNADKTILASLAFGYHNLAYAGTGSFNSCTGTYSMDFTITVDEGSFGSNTFTLTRR